MKEHPILFSGPMVRAILEGRKTQTRRVIKPQPEGFWGSMKHAFAGGVLQCVATKNGKLTDHYIRCPYGVPGDRLWVRETWRPVREHWTGDSYVLYQASGTREFSPEQMSDALAQSLYYGESWRPSIHMPRWISRITLEISDVRVQRLQEISEEDAESEGAPSLDVSGASYAGLHREIFSYRRGFMHLWDSINAKKHPWASNPWVWAITFRRLG